MVYKEKTFTKYFVANLSIECGDPLEPENCTVSYTSTTVGSVAIYSCNAECHENKYTRICEGNGSTANWTEPEHYRQGI